MVCCLEYAGGEGFVVDIIVCGISLQVIEQIFAFTVVGIVCQHHDIQIFYT